MPTITHSDVERSTSAGRSSSERNEEVLAGWPQPILSSAILPQPDDPRQLEPRPLELNDDTPPLKQLAVSRDGRLLATASWGLTREGELVLWDLASREPVWIVDLETSPRSLVFSEDGGHLAMINGGGEAQVRRVEDGQLEAGFLEARFAAVALSSDGRTLAAAMSNGVVRLFDIGSGQLLETLEAVPPHDERDAASGAWLLSFLENDTQLLVMDGHSALVRKVPGGQTVRTIALDLNRASDAGFAAEAKRLVVVGWSNPMRTVTSLARVWDITSGELVSTLGDDQMPFNCVAISTDGRTIVTGDVSGNVRIWSPVTGELQQTLSAPSSLATGAPLVARAALLSHPPRVAAIIGDRTIEVWNVGESNADAANPEESDVDIEVVEPRMTLSRLDPADIDLPSAVQSVSVSATGDLLASTHVDGTVRMRDAQSGEVLHVLGGRALTLPAQFVDGGRQLVTLLAGQTVVATDVANHEEQTLSATAAGGVTAMAGTANRSWLVTADKVHTCRLWDTRQLEHSAAEFTAPSAVSCIAFSPDETAVAIGLSDGAIELLSLPELQAIKTLSGHTDALTAVAFSPTGESIASTSKDRTVRIWDRETGAQRTSLRSRFGAGPSPSAGASTDEAVRLPFRVTTIAYSDSGRWLAAGGSHGVLEVWDAADGAHVQSLRAHRGTVRSLAAVPGEDGFVSGGDDAAVRRWLPHLTSAVPQPVAPGLLGFSVPAESLQTRATDAGDSERLVLESSGRIAGVTFGPIPRDPTKHHAARSHVKFLGDGQVSALLQIDYYDADGHVLASIDSGRIRPDGDSWQVLAVDDDIHEPPAEARYVGLTLLVRGTATLQLRQLELVAYDQAAGENNLFANGSMETVAGQLPRGWFVYERNNSGATVRVSDRQPYDGHFCLHLTGHGDWVEAYSTSIVPEAGQTYVMTGHVRATRGKVGLQIAYWDSDSQFLGKSFVPSVTPSTWTKLAVVSEVDKFPGTRTISGAVIARGDVEAWCDGLQLVPADPSTAARLLAGQHSTAPSGSPDRPDWSLSQDKSGSVDFTTLDDGGDMAGPVLRLKGKCQWAVLSSRERLPVETWRRYVLRGQVRRVSGEALIKIDYYADRKLLGRTCSPVAGGQGDWESLRVASELPAHPQATHIVAAAVGRGAVEAEFRDLQLEPEAP